MNRLQCHICFQELETARVREPSKDGWQENTPHKGKSVMACDACWNVLTLTPLKFTWDSILLLARLVAAVPATDLRGSVFFADSFGLPAPPPATVTICILKKWLPEVVRINARVCALGLPTPSKELVGITLEEHVAQDSVIASKMVQVDAEYRMERIKKALEVTRPIPPFPGCKAASLLAMDLVGNPWNRKVW